MQVPDFSLTTIEPATASVVVTDIQMKFWSMCLFMVKWAFAAIPALFIIGVILIMISAIFMAVFGVFFGAARSL